ncbi:MAG: CvpA family protein [Puniceicoccales bacterium]|jgi:uncharacterized membrane protein required for colicin V production|nr:CvpA family protein [Puniceicoccales bacterium]
MTLPAVAVFFAAAPVPGSHKVLLGCFLVVVAAMFAGTRKGYWRGPLRQLTPTIALLVASVLAWMAGPAFGHSLLRTTAVPWLLRGVAGMGLLGAIVFLAAFALLWRIGRSRHTNHIGETDNPVLGALVGCWTALLWSAAVFLSACAAASVGEFWLADAGGTASGWTPAHAVARNLSRMKNSLALARGLGWLRHWNPLPGKTRRTLEKGMLVLSTPKAVRQLSRMQAVRAIATHPAFYPLRDNPEIRRLALETRDIEGLLAHPLVTRMLADESFQRLLADVDLETLFTSALSAATTSASPKESDPPAAAQSVAKPVP